jgi:beta-lactamase regulating signal transducer with metallopeptidase domain
MSNELIAFLFEATTVTSLALLGVLVLRGVWLRWFGARNALLLWLVVPVGLVALFFPAPVQHIDPSAEYAVVNASGPKAPLLPAVRNGLGDALPALSPRATAPATSGAFDPAAWTVGFWIVGAAMFASFLALSQRQMMRSLGRLKPMPDGSYRSARCQTGPVLVGALRPRIVLPADFEQRYSPEQQELVVEHERCHLRRGDAQFTLLACVFRCVFWFNPLIHLAWPRFRIDQELACDAAVLGRYPQRRREYAEAMLATRFQAAQLPVGCAWLTGHPLKQRIRMIAANPIGTLRVALGTGLVVVTGSVAALGSWAHQEPERFFVSADGPRLQLPLEPAELQLRRAEWPRSVALSASPMPVAAVSMRPPASPTESEALSAPEPARNPPEMQEPASPPPPPGKVTAEPDMVNVDHAQLVAAFRPAFPDSRFQPRLVRYPGMPAAEQPGEGWRPEGELWVLLLRASLDDQGRAIDAFVEDTNLDDELMVERYERVAMEAIRNWRFSPARIDGAPVRSEVLLPFYFDTRKAYFDTGRSFALFDDARLGPVRVNNPAPSRRLVHPINRQSR